MRRHPLRSRTVARLAALTACACATVLTAGCHEEEIGYTEVKRIDEVITPRDFDDLVSVLRKIDEADRQRLPSPFIPPPHWPEDRTLPVRDLLREDAVTAKEAWNPEQAARALPVTPRWERALRSRELTPAQFASLVLSAAATIGRSEADPQIDLKALAARGAKELTSLSGEERTFAALSPEERHAVLSRAAWLATADRAARLALVPPENVLLVREREKELRELLPRSFFHDPFAGLYPRAADYGVPFEEGPLSDARLTWSPDHAIIGTDPADGLYEASKPAARH